MVNTWGKVNTWVDSGAISVITTLGTINYTDNDVVISLTGTVEVPATLGTIDYNSNNVNVLIAAGVVVSPTIGTINYTSNNVDITFAGLIDVSPTLGTITYNSNKALIGVGQGQTLGNITASFADSGISVKYKLNEITVNFK